MSCVCKHPKHVTQSLLDITAPYIYTKAETPDPVTTTSATAYNKFQRELRKWIGSILRDAVTDVNIRALPTADAFVAEVDRAIRTRASKLPVFLRMFLERQATAGYTMGQTMLPSMVAEGLTIKDQIRRVMQEQMVRLSNQGIITARGTFGELLGDSLETGATPREMAQRVEQWSKQRGDQDRSVRWRAERIARTESSRALNTGQVAAWEDMGVTRMKWATAPNSCEFCNAMETGSQSIKQPFLTVGSTLRGKDGGTMSIDYAAVKTPPLHPNCRCTLLPIVSNR